MSAVGFKRLGIAVAALAAAGLIALVFASFFISADNARDAVIAEIRAATGLEPEQRGPTSIAIFPSATINLADVVLIGDGAEPALTAQRLTAHLRPLALLSGRIEIADIALIHPRIALTFRPDGRSNWSPLLDRLGDALRPKAGGQARLSFSEIRVTEGTLAVSDRSRGIDETLRGIEFSLAWPSISKSFAATGRFTWRNDELQASVSISDFLPALLGDSTGLKFRLSGTHIKVAFDGAMSHRPTLKIDGTLAADGASLRDAMSWIGSLPPPPGAGLGRFALKARTSVVGGTFGLSSLNIDVDGNVAEGVLSYPTSGRKVLQGTLAVETLDLTPYIPTFRSISNAGSWDGTPMALEWANGFEVDLRLSAANVTLGTAKLGRTALAATYRDGRLAITIGESQAFNGVINGSIALGKSDAGTAFRSQLQFTDVDLDSCLAELVGVRRVEGKGNLAFTLEGGGRSVLALTRTLNGTASLAARRGALVGLNVEQLLRRLERRPLSGGGDFRSGRTPYDTLTIAMRIVQGTATVETMHLDGPSVRLAVAGSASIPTRELDLTGTASLLAAPNDATPGFELPFVVQGPWDEPLMLPDPQILIRRSGAAAPLLDAVREKKTRDAVRSAIERLTGPVDRRPANTAPAAEPEPAAASER